MEFNRYGKLYWKDYKFTLASIGGFVLLAIVNLALSLPLLYSIFPLAFAIIWTILIVRPHMERFTVCDHFILVRQGKHTHEIPLPPNIIVVFSQADIRDTFSVQSYLLRNKYAISLLRNNSLEDILQILHANRVKKYTNSSIEAASTHSLIYSFVYNEYAFTQILKHGVSKVIIPESLVNQIDLSSFGCSVFIDEGF